MKEIEVGILKDSFKHVAKKQKLSSSRSIHVADQITHEIEQALAKINSVKNPASPVDPKSVLEELNLKLNSLSPLDQLEAPQKELTVETSQYLKLLEKAFYPDISKAYINTDSDCHTVNQILATEFYRQGLFDLGGCFINEAGESLTTALRSQFLILHRILDAIKVKNLEPALQWVSSNREKLNQIGSNLELKIHQLQFIDILKQGTRADALAYAKTHFPPLATHYMKELQKLTVSICWIGKLESYPHPEVLDPSLWETLTKELARDFCYLLGQPYESSLIVAITAGIEGLPTLLKLAEVMSIKKQEWKAMKQLPVPIELGKEFQFHSIFVCPVSREQASEDNPPMLMPCMHVLCKQSINRMSKGGSRTFKCPSCPAEISSEKCRQLYF